MSGTTTNYGWTYPSSTDLAKLGASDIQTLATGVDTTLGTALNNKTHAGLVLVKTQTIGTGVTSVTVTGAFSSTYDNYRIVFTTKGSVDGYSTTFKLSGSTGSPYVYSGNVIDSGGTRSGLSGGGVAQIFTNYTTVTKNGFVMDICDPYNSTQKIMHINGFGVGSGQWWSDQLSGSETSTNSNTGFVIAVTSGTMTGGTIAVYGYAKD